MSCGLKGANVIILRNTGSAKRMFQRNYRELPVMICAPQETKNSIHEITWRRIHSQVVQLHKQHPQRRIYIGVFFKRTGKK